MTFVSIILGVLVVVAFVTDDVVFVAGVVAFVAGVVVVGSATLNGAVMSRNIVARSNKKFVVVIVVDDVDEKVLVVESFVLSTASVCLDLLLIEFLGL